MQNLGRHWEKRRVERREQQPDPRPAHRHPVCPWGRRTAEAGVSGPSSAGSAPGAAAAPPAGRQWAAFSANPPTQSCPGQCPAQSPWLRTPRSRTPRSAGAHLRLVTVGPVGPVAEIVAGSHFLAQRLRRGQEEHGESQREPHRRLDVLRGRGWSPVTRRRTRTALHTLTHSRSGAQLGTSSLPHTYSPKLHRHPRPACCRPLWIHKHPPQY